MGFQSINLCPVRHTSLAGLNFFTEIQSCKNRIQNRWSSIKCIYKPHTFFQRRELFYDSQKNLVKFYARFTASKLRPVSHRT